ncbi:hypothetical protein [Ensifer adhaerens]|nr:hypothetical protein [Ensifer adhaerens]
MLENFEQFSLSSMEALKAELDRIIETCQCGTVAECRIIDSLSPGGND